MAVAVLLVSMLSWAQEQSVIPLIPAANWRLIGSRQVALDEVSKWGGDGAIEREYGVQSLTERTYQLDSHTARALLEETPDASSAYGLLTFYQTEAMTPDKSLALVVLGPQGALMARGRVFIRVTRPDNYPLSETDFSALLIFIGGMRGASGGAGLPPQLPVAGRVPCSEKYLLGPEAARRVLPSLPVDLLGFSQSAEAQVASYRTTGAENARATLLLISYPNPQIARARYKAIEEPLHLNQERGAESAYGTRQGSFVLVVLNAPSKAAASKILDEFKVSQQVSWDQRYPGEEPIVIQMAKLVLGNMFLVLILIVFAIVGGLLVFAFKRLTAKWFPESAWAHWDEGQIIRLSLRYNKPR